jgi:putative flippase GtrA
VTPPSGGIQTWLRFNVVGIAGAIVQLTLVAGLTRASVHYLLATALGVEAAILNNFYWHTRWTWRDREPRLWRFHIANGAVSLLSNLILMRIFTGWLGVPPVPANLGAITLTSLVNFVLGDRWVFRRSLENIRRRVERMP